MGAKLAQSAAIHSEMPLGIVIRKTPGVTRWAVWSWKAVAVLPGAGPADWVEMRRQDEAVEYHAATLPLTLWAAETEAYLANLTDTIPSIYVVLREDTGEAPFDVVLVTASTYEAQDYADSSEEIVEKVAMPDGLIAWVRDFVQEHHEHEDFIKRRRDRARVDLVEDGKGDLRIRQESDVYRAPKRAIPKRVVQ
ncbi:MAG: hypothetical protein ACI92Z_001627 [Paracoccaceae bacterium]